MSGDNDQTSPTAPARSADDQIPGLLKPQSRGIWRGVKNIGSNFLIGIVPGFFLLLARDDGRASRPGRLPRTPRRDVHRRANRNGLRTLSVIDAATITALARRGHPPAGDHRRPEPARAPKRCATWLGGLRDRCARLGV